MLAVFFQSGASDSLIGWFVERLSERPIVLVVFGAVFAYTTYQIWRVIRETRACHAFVRAGKRNSNAQTVQQLYLFLEESERWRQAGVSVPMTDYSDRLDSYIEGVADHLHNGVNLFLIVGLAGTFFGMAEFARQAPSITTGADPKAVLEALRNALGHAFPVGFIGLALTILAHPIVGTFESRLRLAVKDAVNHAIRLRNATLGKEGVDAVVRELRDLPNRLATTMKTSLDSLQITFGPLLQIPQSIQEANEQSLGPIRELVAESRKEWKDTVTKLSKQSSRTAEAIERLERPITDLTDKIGQVGALVSSTEEALLRVIKHSESVASTLDLVNGKVLTVVETIDEASRKFEGLPGIVQQQVSMTGKAILQNISDYFQGIGKEYVTSVRDLASATTFEISSAASKGAAAITEAAQRLHVAADVIAPELQAAIRTGADHLRTHLNQFNEAFGTHFPDTVKQLQMTLREASGQIEDARAVLQEMAKAASGAEQHARSWNEVERKLQVMADALDQQSKLLGSLGAAIEKSAAAHNSVPSAVRQSTSEFVRVSETLAGLYRSRKSDGERKKWWPFS